MWHMENAAIEMIRGNLKKTMRRNVDQQHLSGDRRPTSIDQTKKTVARPAWLVVPDGTGLEIVSIGRKGRKESNRSGRWGVLPVTIDHFGCKCHKCPSPHDAHTPVLAWWGRVVVRQVIHSERAGNGALKATGKVFTTLKHV